MKQRGMPEAAGRDATVVLQVTRVDCAGCARKLEREVGALPGIVAADFLLTTGELRVRTSRGGTDEARIRGTLERLGHPVLPGGMAPAESGVGSALGFFGLIVGAVLLIVVVGEWLGLFHEVSERVPLPAGAAIVAALGFGVFRRVGAEALRGRIGAHTLVTVGAIAALLVGEWTTAVVIVFFMRIADRVERFTVSRGRRALAELTSLVPPMATVERDGAEVRVAPRDLAPGDVVLVRPGERLPADGEVVAGHAALDQSAITGEGLPVEVEPGSTVFAATLVHGGVLRVRVARAGADSTFGRVVRMVEEAETHRAEVQRTADRFATWYLPVVLAVAGATWWLRGDVLAAAAVLVVACACAFALATPVAMIASIAAGARQGLLIKGGRYVEALARADVLLLDKTGTLTAGRPRITAVVPLAGATEEEIVGLAAAAERFSEHPLADAVRALAARRGIPEVEPDEFEALPGRGVRARIGGALVEVGNARLIADPAAAPALARLQESGASTLIVARDGRALGVLAAEDTLREDVPAALAEIRALGIERIEILTGDNPRAAAALAAQLGVGFRAALLPEDKVAAVAELQAKGHTVAMVGDGVNDAPALRRADVGISLGSAGTDVALEAADIALMGDDWALLPRARRIAQRTMRTVRMNLAYTVVYNVVGISLAALGLIPPIVAAAAHSVPDLVIVANSSRLLRSGDVPASPGSPGISGRRAAPAAAPACAHQALR